MLISITCDFPGGGGGGGGGPPIPPLDPHMHNLCFSGEIRNLIFNYTLLE